MANLSVPAPFEPEKSPIHDRTLRPANPKIPRPALFSRYWGFGLGLCFAALLLAMAFSARDGWENHREWVVAVTGPFYSLGGIAFGHVFYRRRLAPAAPAFVFLFLAAVFLGADILADLDDADMTARDVLSILGGICLGFAVAGAIFAAVWVELRSPTKAPPPQM